MPLITFTRCQRDWPRRYRSYHQETEPPYRRADSVTVYRLGTRGLVVGCWTSHAEDEHQALEDALGARPATLLGTNGQLLPNYRRNSPESTSCSPASPQKKSSSARPESESPA
ncbi:hypothetical protein [Streptomyces malaysiensis]|uniref:Uncharacterized protein n=1 Tax=Streptomyces malaysiensis TaxID=92644 RepID=A0A7X6B0B2_STRMQ|nr:hypothetical protein [Streptomyces malaysiensis]NIY68062.1 hypothetical protein [Streptomyces malaysiensis]